jgi:hypothetical protein
MTQDCNGVAADLPLDRDDVVTIMGSLLDLSRKADDILALLRDDEEEEEEGLDHS